MHVHMCYERTQSRTESNHFSVARLFFYKSFDLETPPGPGGAIA